MCVLNVIFVWIAKLEQKRNGSSFSTVSN